MLEEILLTDIKYSSDIKYLSKIQSQKGKSNIYCVLEKDNNYDSDAICVFTKKRDNTIVKIGYIRKYIYEKIFTDRGEEDYLRWKHHNYDNSYKTEYVGEIKEVKKIDIYTEEELKQILKDINNNKYIYRYDYDTNESLLIKKENK